MMMMMMTTVTQGQTEQYHSEIQLHHPALHHDQFTIIIIIISCRQCVTLKLAVEHWTAINQSVSQAKFLKRLK